MSYTIAVPSSSIQKVLTYGIPSITSVSGGVAVANGAVSITSSYPPLPTVVDSAYVQANVATGIATSSYNQANTATTLAQIVYDYANTIQGGAAIDNVARQIALSAQANTIIIQGVNVTQNTWISTNNSIQSGINSSQNTRMSTIETTLGSISVINTNQNNSISIIQSVDLTQDTRLNSIETINNNQNTIIQIIQGVDSWQNSQIIALNQYATSAFNTANSISSGGTSTIDSFARTTANGANGLAQGAFNVANNKVASITGTTNQITVAGTTTIPALSLPQNINTGASVQFGSFGVGTAASGTTGEIRATNEVTAYYSSDERLKENIIVIDDALGKLKQIRGVMYDWKDSHIQSRGGLDDYFVRKHDTGVIAQDVEKVLPEVIAERPDGTKAVRYEKLAGIIIQAINELADQVEEIKKRLD
jgi:hypothetical protein